MYRKTIRAGEISRKRQEVAHGRGRTIRYHCTPREVLCEFFSKMLQLRHNSVICVNFVLGL